MEERGIPEVAGTAAGHGEGGAKHKDLRNRSRITKPFLCFRRVNLTSCLMQKNYLKALKNGQKLLKLGRQLNPGNAKLLEAGLDGIVPQNLNDVNLEFDKEAKLATRAAGGEVLQPIAEAMPMLIWQR